MQEDKKADGFNRLMPYFPLHIQTILAALGEEEKKRVTELRFRMFSSIEAVFMGGRGKWLKVPGGYTLTPQDLEDIFFLLCSCSVYSFMDELRQGFLTIAGGHRAGLCGRAVVKEGKVVSLKDISSINIRISREIRGCADGAMPYIAGEEGVRNTLVLAPPGGGKTTFLRDVARQLSDGWAANPEGVRVGLVDERSEIAARSKGDPGHDVGKRTDVMDGIKKSQAISMMIRSMAPQVIITDELGDEEDLKAVREAVYSGVSVVASVHGGSFTELKKKRLFLEYPPEELFSCMIALKEKEGRRDTDILLFGEKNL